MIEKFQPDVVLLDVLMPELEEEKNAVYDEVGGFEAGKTTGRRK